jgi:hypothetical protein
LKPCQGPKANGHPWVAGVVRCPSSWKGQTDARIANGYAPSRFRMIYESCPVLKDPSQPPLIASPAPWRPGDRVTGGEGPFQGQGGREVGLGLLDGATSVNYTLSVALSRIKSGFAASRLRLISIFH